MQELNSGDSVDALPAAAAAMASEVAAAAAAGGSDSVTTAATAAELDAAAHAAEAASCATASCDAPAADVGLAAAQGWLLVAIEGSSGEAVAPELRLAAADALAASGDWKLSALRATAAIAALGCLLPVENRR